MFELHQVQITRNNIKVREIGFLDNVRDWNGIIIPDRIIERPAIKQIKLRLELKKFAG